MGTLTKFPDCSAIDLKQTIHYSIFTLTAGMIKITFVSPHWEISANDHDPHMKTLISDVSNIFTNWFISQHAFIEIWSTQEVWRAWKMCKSCWRCSPNFPSASYLDKCTADVWTNCFTTFSPLWKIFFLRDLFADVMSMHNRNMKHTHAMEFDWTNLLAIIIITVVE